MTKRNQTAEPRKDVREFDDIEQDLNTVKCQLTCACFALGQAQDAGDDDLGTKAWKVIDSCVASLDRLEDDLDRWNLNREHSLKEVSNG